MTEIFFEKILKKQEFEKTIKNYFKFEKNLKKL